VAFDNYVTLFFGQFDPSFTNCHFQLTYPDHYVTLNTTPCPLIFTKSLYHNALFYA